MPERIPDPRGRFLQIVNTCHAIALEGAKVELAAGLRKGRSGRKSYGHTPGDASSIGNFGGNATRRRTSGPGSGICLMCSISGISTGTTRPSGEGIPRESATVRDFWPGAPVKTGVPDERMEKGCGMEEYYSFVRKEIAPLLPPLRGGRVLDIGCGEGGTSEWLKGIGVAGSVLGVEKVHKAAEEARRRLDEVIEGDAERVGFGDRRFDLVLCLDVLEHMVDPWAFVERIGNHLAPGGVLIASIPNLQNYRVLKDLVLRGRFEYREAGILDRTYLRFFTRHSACRLVETGRLRLQAVHGKRMRKKKYQRIDRMTFGIFRDFFVSQFLLSSTVDPTQAAEPESPG